MKVISIAFVLTFALATQATCWTGIPDEQIEGAGRWNAVATVVGTSEEYWDEAYNRTAVPTAALAAANATVLAGSGPLWDEGYHFQLTPTPTPDTNWAAAATAVDASEEFWDEAYNRTAVPTQNVDSCYAAATVVATSEEFWDEAYNRTPVPTQDVDSCYAAATVVATSEEYWDNAYNRTPVPTYSLSASDIQGEMLNENLDLGAGDLEADEIRAASATVTGDLVVDGDINPGGNNLRDLGSPSLRWAYIYGGIVDATTVNVASYVSGAIVSGASTALAAGDYITLTHNLSTNYIIAQSWIIPSSGPDSGKPINGEGTITIRQEDTNTIWMRNDGSATVNMLGAVFKGK